jgi:hypothetical protein
VWNGEEYEETLYDFIPDHIALLPNELGACSWADGCGVRENIRKSNFNFSKKEEDVMSISKERIDALYTNKSFLLPDDESTRKYLTNMEEAQFEKLEDCQCGEVEALRENVKAVEAEKQETLKANEELTAKVLEQEKIIADKDDGKGEPKVNVEEIKKEILTNMSFEDVISKAPKDIQDSITAGIKLNKEKREGLIKSLDGSPFTNEELEKKSNEELEKLVILAQVPADYSGNLGGNKPTIKNNYEKQPDGTGVPKMPTIAEVMASENK